MLKGSIFVLAGFNLQSVYPFQRLKVCELLSMDISAKLRKIHFAEEWNELHHLLIMEALGGDARYPHVYTVYCIYCILYELP